MRKDVSTSYNNPRRKSNDGDRSKLAENGYSHSHSTGLRKELSQGKTLRALERRTPVQNRPGQTKPRAIQMQMATSARQVLDNVLTREMRGVVVHPRKGDANDQDASGASGQSRSKTLSQDPHVSTSEKQETEEITSPSSPEMPSTGAVLKHRSPYSGSLLPGNGTVSIREKLRQHYKHNISSAKNQTSDLTRPSNPNSAVPANPGRHSLDVYINFFLFLI